MFHEISWQVYWTWMIGLIACYYITIYFLFYRRNLPNVSSQPADSLPSKRIDEVNEFHAERMPLRNSAFNTETTEENELASLCMDELSAFFSETKKVRCFKID